MIEMLKITTINLLELSSTFIIIYALFSKNNKPTIPRTILFILIDLIIRTVFNNTLPELSSWIVCIICECVIIKFLYKESLSNAIIAYMLTFIILSILEMAILIFFPLESSNINAENMQMLGSMLELIVVILLYRCLPFYKLYEIITKRSIYIKIISVNLFIMIIAIVAFSKIDPEKVISFIPITLLMAISLVFANIMSVRQQLIITRQQHELEIYNTYAPIFNDLIEHVKERQHDYNNQLMSIKALPLTHTDYLSLSNALGTYSEKMELEFNEAYLLTLNFKLVAGFLFSKKKEAQNIGKELIIDIKNIYVETIVPEYDIIKMLGILIDNAIEAIDIGDKAILLLSSIDNKIHIHIYNKGPVITTELRTKMFQKGYTTKSKSSDITHGLGLYNLLQLIKKYNGDIELYDELINDINYVHFVIRV